MHNKTGLAQLPLLLRLFVQMALHTGSAQPITLSWSKEYSYHCEKEKSDKLRFPMPWWPEVTRV
jgi:hypothetical protein